MSGRKNHGIPQTHQRRKDAREGLEGDEKQLKVRENASDTPNPTVRTYLEWMVELPWSKRSKDSLDLKAPRKY